MTALALVGLTIIIVRGSILAPVRRRVPMLACAMCSGMWVGALSSLASVGAFWASPAAGFQAIGRCLEYGGVVSLGATVADFLLAYLDGNAGGAK